MASKSSKGKSGGKRSKSTKKAAKDLPVQSRRAAAVKGGSAISDPWLPTTKLSPVQINTTLGTKTIR